MVDRRDFEFDTRVRLILFMDFVSEKCDSLLYFTFLHYWGDDQQFNFFWEVPELVCLEVN